jgi:hypothetical protein
MRSTPNLASLSWCETTTSLDMTCPKRVSKLLRLKLSRFEIPMQIYPSLGQAGHRMDLLISADFI